MFNQTNKNIFLKINWNTFLTLIFVSCLIIIIPSVGSHDCIIGFPAKFLSRCLDKGGINIFWTIRGFLIDLLFWFSVTYFTFVFFRWTAKNKYRKYLLNPVLLLILGLSIHNEPGTIFYVYGNRGFPLEYFNNWKIFNYNALVIDFVFFLIFNFIFIKITERLIKIKNRLIIYFDNCIEKKIDLKTNLGKIKLLLIFYGSFWLLSYGIFMLIDIFLIHEYFRMKNLKLFTLFFFVIPYFSFYIPEYIKRFLKFSKKINLYLLHILIIFIIVMLTYLFYRNVNEFIFLLD